VKNKRGLSLAAVLLVLLLGGCGSMSDKITVFTNVNVVPMTEETIIENQAVLVEGAKITAIDGSDALRIPEGAQLIDGDGAYLVPGLADMHMHTRQDWEDREAWPGHPLSLYLANGVTTVRDFAPVGSPLTYALQWRDEIGAGTRQGPTVYASGRLLYASPLGDPESIVWQNYDLGFDFLKLYSYLSKDDFREAMTVAKALNMYTAGHIPYAVGLDGVLAAGMDEIAHVEELLFEFIEFDRDRQLSPEEWMAYLVESAMHQFALDSGIHQADFEKENSTSLQHIANLLQAGKIPVCTTMVIDDTTQLKLFQPDVFLARQKPVLLGWVSSRATRSTLSCASSWKTALRRMKLCKLARSMPLSWLKG